MSIPGLTALREPTVFKWETEEDIGKSRFVLSRNANPLAGPYEAEIVNPGRSVSVNSLAEGRWYWTIEAQTADGQTVLSGPAGSLIVQAIPLLPQPEMTQPEREHRIDAQELRASRQITFNWSQVEGANSYILTISRKQAAPAAERQQILQTQPLRQLNYTFDNLSLLDHSAEYVWQVEALFISNEGKIEQRGRQGESAFTVEVKRPGQAETKDTGVLYGF